VGCSLTGRAPEPHRAPPPPPPRTPKGKSTVLRAVAAAALLANCGLMVPAAAAAVPHYSGFVLRNFSGDAPTERMSAFGMEIRDMT
jgi:DNA mismatch repair ATPase MutS